MQSDVSACKNEVRLNRNTNWVTFKRRMTIDIEARAHLIQHLEGQAPHPKAPAQPKGKPTQQEQDEYEEKLEKYKDAVDLWCTCDAIVKRQIIHNIPNTVLICIQNLSTIANMWDALQREFKGWTAFVQNDLRHKISLAKCGENENVHEHTDQMQYMFEELAGMGVKISDNEYLAMLMRSMPNTYANFLTPIITLAHTGGNPLTPYALMDYVVSEYDQRLIQNPPKQCGSGTPPTGNTALYSFVPDSGCSGQHGKCKGKDDEKRTCFNCREAGHLKRNCQKPKKDGEKPKGSRNGNASQGASTGAGKAPQQSASIAEVKEPSPPPVTVYSAAALAGYTREVQGTIFNSGCMVHVSPYHELFTNYTPINSIPITAANKTYFQAIGQGDVEVALPNGGGTTQMILCNILHCPRIAFTLVSMSVMDRARYSFMLKNSWMSVIALKGNKIADIPLENGLYRILTQEQFASIATGGELVICINELHHQLGHLGIEACCNVV